MRSDIQKHQSSPSQHIVLLQNALERARVKAVVVGHHFDNACEVGDEIALVAVCQKGRHGSRVKLNVVVVDLDEMRRGICVYQR